MTIRGIPNNFDTFYRSTLTVASGGAPAAVALLFGIDALLQRLLLRGRLMLRLTMFQSFRKTAMIFLRAIAFFILLFLLASPPPEAQAGLLPLLARSINSGCLLFGTPYYRGQCPRLCDRMVRWLQQLHL